MNIYLSQSSRLWYHFLNYSKNLKFALEISKFVNLVDVKQSDIFKNNLAYALELNEIKEETFLQFGMSLQLVVEPVVCTLY